MDHKRWLEGHIPYRLKAVSTLALAWKWWRTWESPKKLEVFFDGELAIEGNSNVILNPILDSGFVHARALLEFLGFCVTSGKLSNIKKRRPDDVGIEHFSVGGRPLEMVTPEIAFQTYSGSAEDVEQALLSVFHIASKGFAHFSSGMKDGQWSHDNVATACEGIPVLVINQLYVPLGLSAPEYELKGRPRDR